MISAQATKYLEKIEENPDLAYFLSTKEILEYILKCPSSQRTRVATEVTAIRNPPIPHHLVDPKLTNLQSKTIWGRSTKKGKSPSSSLRTQNELAHWWRTRRKEIREFYKIPINPTVDDIKAPNPKEKYKVINQYAEVLNKYPEILKFLSTREILQGILQKEPENKDVNRVKYLGFQRHPKNPQIYMNKAIKKERLTTIWKVETIQGKMGESINKKLLLQEEKKAQEWLDERENLAKKINSTLKKPEIPDILKGLNFEKTSLKQIGNLLGVSEERARQIQKKLGLPKQKSKRTLNEEWVKNQANEIENYTLEELKEILQTNQMEIKSVLRKTKLLPKKHPIYDANLRLRSKELSRIYQVSQGQVTRARAYTKTVQEQNHPNYAQWVIEEEEKAANVMKLWNIISPPQNNITFPEGTDWTKTIADLTKETGASIYTIHMERSKRGITPDPAKRPKPKEQNSTLKKIIKLIQNNPEFVTLPAREIAKAIGKEIQERNVQNVLPKYLNRNEIPKVIELIKPTLQILSESPLGGKDLKNQLAIQMKIGRGILAKTLSKSKTTRFENLTHHCRATLTQGGYLHTKDGILSLTQRGKDLHTNWDNKNPPTITELRRKKV